MVRLASAGGRLALGRSGDQRSGSWRSLLGLCGALVLLIGGCRTTGDIASEVRARIQSRAERHFEAVNLLKPDPVSAALHPLAPLILLEADDGVPASCFPLAVYSWTNMAGFRGESLPHIVFVWQKAGHDAAGVQGVRLTLDRNGMPLLWEVLHDSSGARVVYVTESLEAEAQREFGAPVAGRRYHVEPARPAGWVIARVLDEAAVPMGPMLYVEANTGDVSTVICRCMPAQADRVKDTATYTVLTVTMEEWQSVPAILRRAARDWAPDRSPMDLTRLLRARPD